MLAGARHPTASCDEVELPSIMGPLTAVVIIVDPVRRTYRAPRNPVPWLELASADGPWRSGLHASTIILGSIVLTDAIEGLYVKVMTYHSPQVSTAQPLRFRSVSVAAIRILTSG